MILYHHQHYDLFKILILYIASLSPNQVPILWNEGYLYGPITSKQTEKLFKQYQATTSIDFLLRFSESDPTKVVISIMRENDELFETKYDEESSHDAEIIAEIFPNNNNTDNNSSYSKSTNKLERFLPN